MVASNQELEAMRQAIVLSAHGLGTASPNPPVGCIILDVNGQNVGSGFHHRKGEPHAEDNALRAAGGRAAGGTAVVTLEPCNHHGRTPPCHQSLIDAGIRRVLISLIDPTSRGSGGAARLLAAGIDVEVGVLASEAQLVLGPWLNSQSCRRPSLTVTPDIDLVPQMRASCDAVLFSDGTVEEGIPGGHGEDFHDLPGRLIAPLEVSLDSLYQAGVRTAIAVVMPDQIRIQAALECVDRIVALTDVDIPSNFELISVDKLSGGLILQTYSRLQ